jgi:glutamate racemase
VTLVGSARLAGFAEAELAGTPVPDAELRAEIAPCFAGEDAQPIDTVVLACTHFPLLLERLRALAPWPVTWIDPAPAIARRVTTLVGPPVSDATPATELVFTSGRGPSAIVAAALRAHGVRISAITDAAGT